MFSRHVPTANNIWTNLTLPYIQAAITKGFKLAAVVVATTIPRYWQSISARAAYGYELTRQALKALVNSNAATYGFTVADYGSVAGLGSGTHNVPNLTYYGNDQIDLKAAGYALMEPTARAALNATIASYA